MWHLALKVSKPKGDAGSNPCPLRQSGVAQLVAQAAVNRKVVGSNPTTGASPRSPTAEAAASNPAQCRFESYRGYHGPVAQSVVRRPVEAEVVGSSPVWVAIQGRLMVGRWALNPRMLVRPQPLNPSGCSAAR